MNFIILFQLLDNNICVTVPNLCYNGGTYEHHQIFININRTIEIIVVDVYQL